MSELYTLVNKLLPNITVDNIQINDRGWDNDIIIINNDIVLRLPKSEELLSKILDEVKLLNCLRRKHPLLKVPDYRLVYIKDKIKGVKYTFIEGKSLTECGIHNLSNNSKNAKLIGDFLSKLHSINPSELKDSNVQQIHTLNYWENLFLLTKKNIFPYLNSEQKNEITEFFTEFIYSYPSLSYKNCIIHGDLTASNIIYNEGKELVDGIIDFTDSQIGDPAFDFAGLYWTYGPKFTKEVLSFYDTSETKDTIYSRVSNFYGLQPVFHELIYDIKNRQSINWDSTIGKFLKLKNSIES